MSEQAQAPIIIVKRKGGHGGHHGGAWKVAYADFVTAMMAFFLLLWLISMTTPEQKEGLASYFAPPNVAPTTSGAGGTLGGTALDDAGAQMSGSVQQDQQAASVTPKGEEFGTAQGAMSGQNDADGSSFDAAKASQYDLKAQDDQGFHSAAASIRQAWQAMPDIAEIADNLIVEETEEGLNIKIVDQEGRPMFPEGSKYPNEITRKAIAAIAPTLQKLSNRIKVSGHAAAGGVYANPRYGSWELTSDRANSVRQILSEFGLRDDRVDSVVGRSTNDPFFPNDPYMAANERIEITVLHENSPVPADLTP
jgi:chemotaxis protein MotB